MSRGRIAFFVPYPHVYGGAEHVVLLLARGLADRGWTTEVVAPGPGPTVDRSEAAGLPVEVVEPPSALGRFGGTTSRAGAALAIPAYWRRLAKVLRGADVVQTYAQRGVLLAGPAARLARVPLVWNVVGVEPSKAATTAGAAVATVVAPVSTAVGSTLPRLARRRRSTVVRNGTERIDVELGEPSLHPLVACVARLTPEKGVDVLVRAFAVVRDRHPHARLVVIGPEQQGHEAYATGLRALADELGIADAVDFTGAVDEPSDHWRDAWVYAQPSRTEGFGLAAVEAMAAGLAVVASDVDGLAEVLDDGRTGLLVPAEQPIALAGAIDRLIDDRALAARLGAAARAEVRTTYTVERMLDGFEAVYADVRR